MDYNCSLAGPSSLCFVCLLGLIVPNFRSLCHIPLTFNWSAIEITDFGTKCTNADSRFTLLFFRPGFVKKTRERKKRDLF